MALSKIGAIDLLLLLYISFFSMMLMENLQKQYRKFLYTHHPTSLNINVLYNQSIIVKSRKLPSLFEG